MNAHHWSPNKIFLALADQTLGFLAVSLSFLYLSNGIEARSIGKLANSEKPGDMEHVLVEGEEYKHET